MKSQKARTGVSLGVVLLVAGIGVAAHAGDILVYNGDGALNQGYVKFGLAAGKTVKTLDVLPPDLSTFDCIVLPVNRSAFSESTLAAFNGYVSAGGRLIALGEWEGFVSAIPNMNAVASSLGSDLSLVSAFFHPGFTTTHRIDSSPFTIGVSSIRLAATSEVQLAVGPFAHSLVRTQFGATFIGIDRIGSGVFVLSGDSNAFSDDSDNAYTVHDNDILVANICDQAGFNMKPLARCTESFNPSGKNTPPAGNTTLPDPKRPQNADGFYELVGEDDEDGTAPVFVTNASGSATFGPFSSGSVVKITEAPGATPTARSMGGSNSAVETHITLDSDAFVFSVDSSGDESPVTTCLVPPPK